MNLGTDLLNLRRNKASTVAILISGIERLATARSETTIMTRTFALNELADAVLAQVAVHALDAFWDDGPPRKPDDRPFRLAGVLVTPILGNCISGDCPLRASHV
jgi:hypothetical protein